MDANQKSIVVCYVLDVAPFTIKHQENGVDYLDTMISSEYHLFVLSAASFTVRHTEEEKRGSII